MNLFCLTDTHGKAPPSIPPKTDLVLHAGDFYNRLGGNIKGLSKMDSQKVLNNEQSLTKWYKSLKCPANFVKGNHDTFDPYQITSKNDATGFVSQIAPKLFLIGLGWSGNVFYELPTNDIMNKICADVLRQCCFKMKDGDMSIVLTHYAPLVPPLTGEPGNKEGWAFQSIRDVLNSVKPILCVCGHLHDVLGTKFYYNNTLIDFPGKEGSFYELDTNDWVLR
jgi:Icc-related predicted phosphoesterase